MEVTSEKSIRLPTFGGEHKDFQMWWVRFTAFASVYGFAASVGRTPDPNLPGSEDEVIDESTDEGKLMAKARKKNAIAMANLTMAFTSESLLGMVYKAKDSGYPSGCAWKVVDALHRKYIPQDLVSKVELRQALSAVSMKRDEDPAKLFEALSAIENKYNTASFTISNEELIATVLEKAPKEYSTVLTCEQRAKGTSLVMADLLEAMNQLWRTMYNKSSGDDADSGEIGLFGAGASDGIVCYRCGKKGHKAFKCKNPKKEGGGGRGNGGSNSKFGGKCGTCGKKGHKSTDCFDDPKNADKVPEWYKKKKKGSGEAAMMSGDIEVLLSCVDCSTVNVFDEAKIETMLKSSDAMELPSNLSLLLDPNVWVADSGATVDGTSHAIGAQNKRYPTKGDGVTNGNGSTSDASMIADFTGVICDKNGVEKTRVKLQNVKVVPKNPFNLFSLTKRIEQGWTLKGNQDSIVLEKNGTEIKFDIKIRTKEGVIYAMYLKRDHVELAGVGTDAVKKVNINSAHALCGHTSEEATRATAKALGWDITRGVMQPCAACAAGKAKQKNVPKASEHIASKANAERIYMDISTIKGEKDGPKVNAKRHWRILVDERTQMKFSKFFTTKSGMVEPTLEQIAKWKANNLVVKYIRCDNAGENKTLQKRSESKDWKMNLQFEYTARNTPQQNHLAELGFAVLANRGRAMMSAANVPKAMRYQIFPKAFETATLMDGLMVVEIEGVSKTRFEHFAGKLPKFASHLRTWGEAGTVTIKKKMHPKVIDRGIQCMFVGYSIDHEGDCYDFLDPKTGNIYTSRDVVWLRRMYYTTAVDEEPEALLPMPEYNEDSGTPVDTAEDDIVDAVEVPSEGESQENTTPGTTTRTGRTVNQPSWMKEYEVGAYQIGLTPAEERFYSHMRELNELSLFAPETAFVGSATGQGFTHTSELRTMKYNEAMKTPDKPHWDDAVAEEHRKFEAYQAWKEVDRDKVPADAKIVTSTWAMKKKANGVYRARLNARGYEQVDGLHYDEADKAAPVVNDITVRMILVLMIMAGWWAELLDIKGAFLNGRFQNGEQLYMEVPQGFEKFYPGNVLLLLMRTIYGLKQAAMQYWREMAKAFRFMEYERSKADPCLQFKWEENSGLIIWLTWVDDCLITGKKDRVIEAKRAMMSMFECDEVGELKEYVGCKLERNWEEGWVKLTQPVMIQSFIDEFDLGDDKKFPNTPAEPGGILRKPEERNLMEKKGQTMFRRGTGKLLHMMRWTRPEVMNAVRECSRFMSGAAKAHLEAMKRVMRYIVGTPKRGMKLHPNAKWDGSRDFEFEIVGKSDSDWAKDETRRSVNGWSTFLHTAPISQRSKMMPIVALSVTESELFSATLCAQDMLFEMRVLNSIGLKVKLPMKLYVDNRGAKDLCNNWSVGGRTRHIEVKQFFLRELKECGILETEWLSGDDMTSDIFTKNLAGPLFNKHASAFVGEDEYMHVTHEGRVSESHNNRESRVTQSRVTANQPRMQDIHGMMTDGQIKIKSTGMQDKVTVIQDKTNSQDEFGRMRDDG